MNFPRPNLQVDTVIRYYRRIALGDADHFQQGRRAGSFRIPHGVVAGLRGIDHRLMWSIPGMVKNPGRFVNRRSHLRIAGQGERSIPPSWASAV